EGEGAGFLGVSSKTGSLLLIATQASEAWRSTAAQACDGEWRWTARFTSARDFSWVSSHAPPPARAATATTAIAARWSSRFLRKFGRSALKLPGRLAMEPMGCGFGLGTAIGFVAGGAGGPPPPRPPARGAGRRGARGAADPPV